MCVCVFVCVCVIERERERERERETEREREREKERERERVVQSDRQRDARPYLDDSGMPLSGCNIEAAAAVLCEAHNQRHAALLAQHLHPCGPARVMCVRVCVCVCVSQCMRGREKAREMGGGREKEMKAR